MKTTQITSIKMMVVLVCFLLSVSACQSALPKAAQEPTASQKLDVSTETISSPTKNNEEAEIKAGIQNTLDNYNEGLEKNYKSLFMSAIDPDNQALSDIFSNDFNNTEMSGILNTIKLGMKVSQVQLMPGDLVLAKITRDRDGWVANWYFRKANGKWVITEPTSSQAGSPQTLEKNNYAYTTYPITQEMNEKIMGATENARAHVLRDLGKVPEGQVNIHIFPAIGLSPLPSGELSDIYMNPDASGEDDLYILTPTTYFGFYDPKVGWEPELEMLITHELARIAYMRTFGNPGQGVDWLSNGLAEYVAGYDQMPEVKAAVENNLIIPIVDVSPSSMKFDLAHVINLQDYKWSLAYGLSESLVTFIVEKYGGLDSFWALARSYDKTQDMRKTIQETLGISYEDFDAAWRTWLKEEYIHRD